MKKIFRTLPYFIIVILLIAIIFYQDKLQLITSNGETNIESTTILERIESIGKIELVKYSFKEILEITRKTPEFLSIFKLGPDSKAVLITSGEAVGCIDLSEISSEDLIQQGDTLLITLPQPELCYYKVDLENTKLYSLQTGFFTEESKFVEEAYRQAERQIKEAALQSNIIEQTKSNADLILKPILEKISGKKIIIKYQMLSDSTTILFDEPFTNNDGNN